jgi:hypothetical protein
VKHVASVTLILAGCSLAVLAAERDENWVRQRVETIRKSDTDDWRRIPWAENLPAAARQAGREGRPMFLFAHEGNIDTGRC